MRFVTRIATTLSVLMMVSGCGLTASSRNEGFADFDSLQMPPGVDHRLTLSLGPSVLWLAARFVGDEPETQAILRGLDGIRIKVYDITGDEGVAATELGLLSSELQGRNWEPFLRVKEDGEQVDLLVKTYGETIHGLVLLGIDDKEAFVINVMGELQPEQLAGALAALDVSVPAAGR
jgi:hypothetical protein